MGRAGFVWGLQGRLQPSPARRGAGRGPVPCRGGGQSLPYPDPPAGCRRKPAGTGDGSPIPSSGYATSSPSLLRNSTATATKNYAACSKRATPTGKSACLARQGNRTGNLQNHRPRRRRRLRPPGRPRPPRRVPPPGGQPARPHPPNLAPPNRRLAPRPDSATSATTETEPSSTQANPTRTYPPPPTPP